MLSLYNINPARFFVKEKDGRKVRPKMDIFFLLQKPYNIVPVAEFSYPVSVAVGLRSEHPE